MKIPKQVAALYDELFPHFSVLKAEVDSLLYPEVRERDWFYRSRIKTVDSFYQKLELDMRYQRSYFEDFLGCEIVVDAKEDFQTATELLGRFFEIEYQRPRSNRETNIDPENFRFADLRLFVRRMVYAGLPEKA